jgi:hypothetical protein
VTAYDDHAATTLVGTVTAGEHPGAKVRQALPDGVEDPKDWPVSAALMAAAPDLDWTVEHG